MSDRLDSTFRKWIDEISPSEDKKNDFNKKISKVQFPYRVTFSQFLRFQKACIKQGIWDFIKTNSKEFSPYQYCTLFFLDNFYNHEFYSDLITYLCATQLGDTTPGAPDPINKTDFSETLVKTFELLLKDMEPPPPTVHEPYRFQVKLALRSKFRECLKLELRLKESRPSRKVDEQLNRQRQLQLAGGPGPSPSNGGPPKRRNNGGSNLDNQPPNKRPHQETKKFVCINWVKGCCIHDANTCPNQHNATFNTLKYLKNLKNLKDVTEDRLKELASDA